MLFCSFQQSKWKIQREEERERETMILIAFQSLCYCYCCCARLSAIVLQHHAFFSFSLRGKKAKKKKYTLSHLPSTIERLAKFQFNDTIGVSKSWYNKFVAILRAHNTFFLCFFYSLPISSTEANFFFFTQSTLFFSRSKTGKVKQLKIVMAVAKIQGNNNKNTTKLTNYFHSDSGHDIYSFSRLVFVYNK